MPVRVTAAVEALRPYVPGKPPAELERETGVKGALKLASNESALGPSPRVTEALADALDSIHRYPDSNAFLLRRQLAEHLQVSPSQLTFGNGSNELLELFVRTFTTAGDHVVFADPSFVVYQSAAMAQNLRFASVPLRDGVHDLDALRAAITEQTRLVFIANPNNPTGTHVAGPALREFLSSLPPAVLVGLDEAYFEYATAEDYPDGVALLEEFPRLVVFRTFSKAYGLAGLRLGYCVAEPDVTDYMNRVRAPFNANTLAQIAATAALGDQAHLANVVELNATERVRVSRALAERGFRVLPSQANFVYVETKDATLAERLLRLGVIVRPFPQSEGLRVTLGTAAENDRFLAALDRARSETTHES